MGAVLTLIDSSVGDFVAFYGPENDAAPGIELDVVATFQVLSTLPNNADAGNRVGINDGVSRAAIAVCIVKGGVPGIGLLSDGSASDPESYPVFVPVDWTAPSPSGCAGTSMATPRSWRSTEWYRTRARSCRPTASPT